MEANKKHYILCPKCKGKTKVKVNENTMLFNFPLWCQWCRQEYIIDHTKVDEPKT